MWSWSPYLEGDLIKEITRTLRYELPKTSVSDNIMCRIRIPPISMKSAFVLNQFMPKGFSSKENHLNYLRTRERFSVKGYADVILTRWSLTRRIPKPYPPSFLGRQPDPKQQMILNKKKTERAEIASQISICIHSFIIHDITYLY